MLRAAAISRIKEGLDFRVGDDAYIITRLQEAQRHLELGRTLPSFLVEEDATLTVTSGDAEIALPTGFIREADGQGFHYFDSTEDEWVYLDKMDLYEAKSRFVDTVASRPRAYVLRKATIAFFPARDANYDLTWSYYKNATLLDSDIENAWLLYNPDVLIGYTGWKMALDLGNAAAADRFEKLYNIAWTGGFAHDLEREAANDPLYMGGRL